MRRVLLFIVLAVALGVGWILFRTEDATNDSIDVPSAPRVESQAGTAPERPSEPNITERTSVGGPVETKPAIPTAFTAALGSVVGRVLEHDGTPMADFPIDLVNAELATLIPSQADWFEKPDFDLGLDTRSTRTDAAGRFRFDGVHPQSYSLFHLGTGTTRAKWDVCPGAPNPGATFDVGDLKLDRFAILIGRVVGADQQPIAGAAVRASRLPFDFYKFGLDRVVPGCAVTFQMPGTTAWETYVLPPIAHRVFRMVRELEGPATTTAEDGTYRIEGVPLGDVTVIAEKQDFVLGYRGPIKTSDGGEKKVGDVTLEPGQTLVGTVVDGSDAGVEGATVLAGPLFPFFPVAIVSPLGSSRADGSFRGAGFHEGAHVVAAKRREACVFHVKGDIEPGVDEPVIRVDDTTSLRVRVLDPEQKPLTDARIFVQPASEFAEVVLFEPPLDTSGRTKRGPDDTLEVSGLSRRKFNVYAKRDGFSIGKTECDLTQGPATCEIRLETERVASVRVIAAGSGDPIEHAMVMVLDKIDEDDAPGSMLPVAPIAWARTDESGIAVLKGLKEGEQGVRVVHPAYAQGDARVIAPGPPVLVELRAGGSIRGRVVKNGVPIGEGYVVAAVNVEHFLDVLPRMTLASSSDGAYAFERLPAGTYLLKAAKDLEAMSAEMQGANVGNPAALGLGDSLSGILGGFGAVRVSSDAEGAEDDVEPEGEEAAQAEPEESPEVKVRADVGDHDGTESQYSAVVREGQETWLEIDVSRLPGDFEKARLSGGVAVNGAPYSGLQVAISSSSTGAERATTTDAAGRFDFGEVAAGANVLRVMKKNGDAISYLATQKLDLAANEIRSLDVRVEAGYVEGRVRAAKDSAPLENARARLVPLTAKDQADFEGCFLMEASGIDGRFRFDIVPEGRYRIELLREGYSSAKVGPFEVPKRGAPSPIDAKLTECVRVRGTVELPTAGPIPPQMIFVHFPGVSEIDFSGFVFADPKTHAFVAENVAPGEYDVNVHAEGYELLPVHLSVPVNGLDNCVLRPQLAPVPIPIPKVEGKPKSDG